MKDRISRAEAEMFVELVPGDQVEAHDGYGRWQGTVETVAPEHGVLWIRTEAAGRKLLDMQEHTVRRLPQAQRPS